MGELWNVNNGINTNMLLNESLTALFVKIFNNFSLWDAAKTSWLLNAAEHLHSPVQRAKGDSNTVSKLYPIQNSEWGHGVFCCLRWEGKSIELSVRSRTNFLYHCLQVSDLFNLKGAKTESLHRHLWGKHRITSSGCVSDVWLASHLRNRHFLFQEQ